MAQKIGVTVVNAGEEATGSFTKLYATGSGCILEHIEWGTMTEPPSDFSSTGTISGSFSITEGTYLDGPIGTFKVLPGASGVLAYRWK